MNLKTLLNTVLAASLLAAGIARADTPIYKWVDEKGQVHYSTEPHGDTAKQLSIQNSATPHAGTGVTPVPGASTDPAAHDASLVAPQAADSAECKDARDRLFKFTHSDKLYSLDDKGGKVPLTADQKQKAVADARTTVTHVCTGGGGT